MGGEYMSDIAAKPILKWAGGKGQLISEISSVYPDGFGTTITKYAEPFVGGGAILFHILSEYNLDEVYISDVNAELINMYIQIRDNATELINILVDFENSFLPLTKEERKNYYYERREDYNYLIQTEQSKNTVLSAALFIFLNRTCFNGLYRANKKGFFNVPCGDYANPTICNESNILAVSRALQNVTIKCADYSESMDFIDSNTLVYLDPPYRPLKDRGSFTSYTEKDFDDSCQKELAGFIESISSKGAFVILSNSDPKCVDSDDDFFEELYADYDIQRVNAKRLINSTPANRGCITELLIKNY